MIGEIDDAIRALVKASDGIAADVDVALDAPTKDWAARRNAPTVDLFLYDIREDTQATRVRLPRAARRPRHRRACARRRRGTSSSPTS